MDGLPEPVAILDSGGAIVAVNAAWMRVAGPSAGAPAGLGVGASYLAACRSAEEGGEPGAAEIRRGIEAVMSGNLHIFEQEYPCATPEGGRWYQITVTPIAGGGALARHTDVTSRRERNALAHRAEAAIKASESRLQLALDAAGLAVAEVDIATGSLHLSPAATLLLTGSASDDAALPNSLEAALARVHPEDIEGVRHALEAAVAGTAQFDTDLRFERLDGTMVTLSVLARVQTGRDELLAVFSDVTRQRAMVEDLRASQRALREHESHLSSVVAALSEGVLVFDKHGNVLSCNTSAEEILGMTQAELIRTGFTGWRAYGEDGLELGLEALPGPQTALTGQGQRAMRVELVSPGGGRSWVQLNSEPVLDTGLLAAVVVSFTDVTQRYAEEQELLKLSHAIAQSPSTILITDLHANVEYVNAAFERTSGYTAAEVLGKNPRFLASGLTRREVYDSMWGALLGGEPWRGEFVNRRKDGAMYIERAHISPIRDTAGRVTHFLEIKEDVTEHHRNCAELDRHRHHLEVLVEARTREVAALNVELSRRADQAEAATRAKSAFLANMSHEIRTPMNAIMGFTHVLQRRESDPARLHTLGRVADATQHLLEVINDILDFSKIEAGKMDIESIDFDLHDLVRRVVGLVSDKARIKGVTLREEVDAPARWYRGDPTRLSQALLNYLSNAVKFTHRGEVTLRCRVEGAAPDLRLTLELQDTGEGIAAVHLARLFNPFEQADSSATRRHGGSGLGLAITRRLAELMGGTVGVRSEPGVGSTFWLTAPIMPADTADHERPRSTPKRDPNGRLPYARVLVAEDNLVNQEVMRELLTGAGLDVQIADNGKSAIACAAAGDFDMILMDLQMPEMDGLEAARAVRQMSRHRDTPILALTASAFEDDRAACLQAGMDDHIAKPVDPKVLFDRLGVWLGSTGRALAD